VTGELALPTDAELLAVLAEYVAIPSISRSATHETMCAAARRSSFS
jgi:hypothetical protein